MSYINKTSMQLFIPQGKHLSSAAKNLSSKLTSNPIKEALTKAFPTLYRLKVVPAFLQKEVKNTVHLYVQQNASASSVFFYSSHV